MHYCCYLYTRQFPTDGVIKKAMEPYYEYNDHEERPVFKWDFMNIGGRYGGKLKLNVAGAEQIEKYEFDVYALKRRAGRLFRSGFLERITHGMLEYDHSDMRYKVDETEAARYLGYRDGILYVDGAWIPDIKNFDDISDGCFCVIDGDGVASARETWDGENWNTDEHFDEKLKAIARKYRDSCYLTVLDLHT